MLFFQGQKLIFNVRNYNLMQKFQIFLVYFTSCVENSFYYQIKLVLNGNLKNKWTLR